MDSRTVAIGLTAALSTAVMAVPAGMSSAQADGQASITIVQEADPSTTLDFQFGGGLGRFSLDDPDGDDGDATPSTRTFSVAPGPLRVRQQIFRTWPLHEIVCSPTANDAIVDTTKHLLVLDVEAGEDITCTFLNTMAPSGRSRITIVQDTTPGHPIDFRYFGSFGQFQLDDPVVDDADATRRVHSVVVPAGQYRIEQQRYDGWPLVDIKCARAPGGTARVDVNVLRLTVSDTAITCTFSNASRTESVGTLSARVLHDVDGDGRDHPEVGDSWLPGWTVQAIDDFGVATEAVTDDDGRANFTLPPGTYTVCDVLMDGWHRSGRRSGCLDNVIVRPDTTTWTRFAVWEGLAANGNSGSPAASHDGTHIAFSSSASNLVVDDDNDVTDVFVRDSATGATRLISRGLDGVSADDHSYGSAISGDGGRIAFVSSATNLVADDTNRDDDVFLYDHVTESITRVNVADDGAESTGGVSQVEISADGSTIAYVTRANDIVDDDDNEYDVMLFDVATRTTIRVSAVKFNRSATSPDLSADGSKVVYVDSGVRLFDAASGERTLIAEWNASDPTISGDGTRIAFESSDSSLVPDDTNGRRDVFVLDTTTGETVRANLRSNGLEADRESSDPEISTDGRHVTFISSAKSLVVGDRNQVSDVYVHDLQTRTTTRINVDSDGVEADRPANLGSPSGDGTRVVFSSAATTLGPGNGLNHVYVHDVATATTTLVSTPLG